LCAGILIDLDHLVDYYLQQPPTIKVRVIYDWFIKRRFEFIFLFLHSLELLVVLWTGISVFRLGIPWIALAVGLSQHMIFDIIFNRGKLYSYTYFLSFRLMKRFRKCHLERPEGATLKTPLL